MKILKRGIIPAERIWRGTCQNCKSEFEALEKELKITHDQRDGDYASAKCEVCGHHYVYFYLVRECNSGTTTTYISY
jgi:RNase P subunit RPR2